VEDGKVPWSQRAALVWRGSRNARRVAVAAVPVVLVNVVAFAGQLSYWAGVLVPALAVVVAAALELIAVYVAYHAHLAQLANDSALRLRFAAYAIAAVIGALNYSHWCAPHWRPTPVAIVFALCSVLSPWLWGIHTRRASRDALMARKLIEPHALRLGATRWAWHPYRSARVMRAATWDGVTDPAEAIGAVYAPAAGVAGEPIDVPGGSPAIVTGTPSATEGRPPWQWLDDRIVAHLQRMSVRSTADAFGVSKTRVETAKRRAALAAPPINVPAGESASPTDPAGTPAALAGVPSDGIGTAQLTPAGAHLNGSAHG